MFLLVTFEPSQLTVKSCTLCTFVWQRTTVGVEEILKLITVHIV